MIEHDGPLRRVGNPRKRFHEAFDRAHGRMGLRSFLVPLIEYVFAQMQRVPIYTELHVLGRTYTP